MQYWKSIFILLSFQLCIQQHSWAQIQVPSYVQKYFRVNPYLGKFSSFVQALKTDEDLKVLKETLITDTSAYFFQGKYTTFNPFSIKSNDVYVLLTELPFDSQPSDSTSKVSTINNSLYNYVMVGIFENTPGVLEKIKKEYYKIYRQNKNKIGKNFIKLQSITKTAEILEGEEMQLQYIFQSGRYSTDIIKWELRANNKIFFVINHTI